MEVTACAGRRVRCSRSARSARRHGDGGWLNAISIPTSRDALVTEKVLAALGWDGARTAPECATQALDACPSDGASRLDNDLESEHGFRAVSIDASASKASGRACVATPSLYDDIRVLGDVVAGVQARDEARMRRNMREFPSGWRGSSARRTRAGSTDAVRRRSVEAHAVARRPAAPARAADTGRGASSRCSTSSTGMQISSPRAAKSRSAP